MTPTFDFLPATLASLLGLLTGVPLVSFCVISAVTFFRVSSRSVGYFILVSAFIFLLSSPPGFLPEDPLSSLMWMSPLSSFLNFPPGRFKSFFCRGTYYRPTFPDSRPISRFNPCGPPFNLFSWPRPFFFSEGAVFYSPAC